MIGPGSDKKSHSSEQVASMQKQWFISPDQLVEYKIEPGALAYSDYKVLLR